VAAERNGHPAGAAWVSADEKQTFLDTVQQRVAGGNILVIINCNDCAPGPDVIVLARGWYVGVQCKVMPSSPQQR
jgi:hypothetical protein